MSAPPRRLACLPAPLVSLPSPSYISSSEGGIIVAGKTIAVVAIVTLFINCIIAVFVGPSRIGDHSPVVTASADSLAVWGGGTRGNGVRLCPAGMADEKTKQIIKQSIAYRARFRVESKKSVVPFQVVPHPQNRGGDPVKSLRTQQIIYDIMRDGYDPVDANSNAVLVEVKPAAAGGSSGVMQTHFETNVAVDPDMAMVGKLGEKAMYGSLSHSHLNCSFRNILGKKKGCECPETRDGGGTAKCVCKVSPLLDDQGNYDVEKVGAHDAEWGRQCEGGLEWEVLSWKMDEEEPEAALIISIALNKKNETAMKTGHLEILTTLVGLCKPDPQGCVRFEPVRDKLIDLYGSEIDHPDFLHLFKVVCDAGGGGEYSHERPVLVHRCVREPEGAQDAHGGLWRDCALP